MADQSPTPAPATEGHAPNPPSRKTLLIATAGAVVVGALIVLGAVLPAEYAQDPLGIGKATGLSRLWAPKEVTVAATEGNQPLARSYPTGWRTDVIEIPLGSGDDPSGMRANEIEYKVRMKKGATLIYEWSVPDQKKPEFFYYDFHGHTVVPEDKREEMLVSTYKQATGLGEKGSLVAPFDGIHGWYFQNQDVPPMKVQLRIAGFYELIAPGEEGNLAGILAPGQTAAR